MDENLDSSAAPGGFLINNSLPSPAPSNASSRTFQGLPHPRAHSLRPGSIKEEKVRRFAEERLLHVSRRYVKKFSIAEEDDDDDFEGYKSISELCKDVQEVVNILWLSGTPSLQIPYLLNIANEFTAWLGSFPASPTATFALLRKLDHCFASLLSGEDIDSKEALPGFENGLRHGMTATDMVRCKSLVQQTRVLIVDVMSKGEIEEDDTEDESAAESAEPQSEDERGVFGDDDDDDELHMDTARVYEQTLMKLDEKLVGGSGIGL